MRGLHDRISVTAELGPEIIRSDEKDIARAPRSRRPGSVPNGGAARGGGDCLQKTAAIQWHAHTSEFADLA